MSNRSETACVICGAPEPMGLSVCPDCGGTAPSVGDTLIFVKPQSARHERWQVANMLDRLLRGRAHHAERRLVAAGHQALVRVPAALADRVVRQLSLQGVPALARAARSTFAPLPTSFALLLTTIAIAGTWAGMVAEPMLRWTSPLVAILLLLASQLRLRQPAIGASKRRRVFPKRTERIMVETFAQLPDGEARELLARIVRASESVYRTLHASGATSLAHDIDSLLQHACRAGVDLSELDAGLAVLGDEPGTERSAQMRTKLAARLSHCVHVLYRLHAETVDADPARAQLTDLLEALEMEAEAYGEVRRELEAML